MLNAATRTVRGGSSPNFIHTMNNDDGLSTKRNTPPFSFPKDDKTGAHSIAALDRYICDSKNGSTYSNNIKASIGEQPDIVNPYIPTKTGKPLPRESFKPVRGKLANSCGCGRNRPVNAPAPAPQEGFRGGCRGCGCESETMKQAKKFMTYAPIAIVVLVIVAAFLVARIIIQHKNKGKVAERRDNEENISSEQSSDETMSGGVIDRRFDAII